MAPNSNFQLITCLVKLYTATCFATHCGSSDNSASSSQNWSTKVYANKYTTIQALKEKIKCCITKSSYTYAKLWLKIPSKERKCPSKAEANIYQWRVELAPAQLVCLGVQLLLGRVRAPWRQFYLTRYPLFGLARVERPNRPSAPVPMLHASDLLFHTQIPISQHYYKIKISVFSQVFLLFKIQNFRSCWDTLYKRSVHIISSCPKNN